MFQQIQSILVCGLSHLSLGNTSWCNTCSKEERYRRHSITHLYLIIITEMTRESRKRKNGISDNSELTKQKDWRRIISEWNARYLRDPRKEARVVIHQKLLLPAGGNPSLWEVAVGPISVIANMDWATTPHHQNSSQVYLAG